MNDKISILKTAADEATKAADLAHGNLESARNRLSGHRRNMEALNLENAARDATRKLDTLRRQLEAAEIELQRHNSGMNQRKVATLRNSVEAEAQRVQEAGSQAKLVEARHREEELQGKVDHWAKEVRQADKCRSDAAALLDSVTQWLDNAGDVEALQVTAPKGATLEGVRADIAKLQAELVEVDSARLDNATLKKQARSIVAQAAESATPTLSGIESELAIESSGNAFAFMAWAYPDPLLKRLESQIDALPGNGLSVKERKAKRAELEAKILEAERMEEALILRDGGERRPNASPEAVLQVKPKESAKAA